VVYGNAWVSGDAVVYGNAWVHGKSRVSGDAWVRGDAEVFEDARVSGHAKVYGNAQVYGNALVGAYAQISGHAKVYGDDIVTGRVINIVGLPQSAITVTDNHVNIGCLQYTLRHWIEHYEEIGKKHNYSLYEIKIYGTVLHTLKEMRK
jgi:predicted acyltransferase (DUF342 family)